MPLLRKWTSIPERVDREELLDLHKGSLDEAARSLADLARINRWLGGGAFLRRFLFPRMRRLKRERRIRILDAGAGAAPIPAAIARWARTQRRQVEIVALDNNRRHLAIAREEASRHPEIQFVQADIRSLPFARESFDFVISTLLLHHFDAAALARILPMLADACRGTVILNDLIRDRVPLAFFSLFAPLLARSPLTRHDGPLSIRRAYTPSEMQSILQKAGFEDARIYTHGLYYRMTAVIERNAG